MPVHLRGMKISCRPILRMHRACAATTTRPNSLSAVSPARTSTALLTPTQLRFTAPFRYGIVSRAAVCALPNHINDDFPNGRTQTFKPGRRNISAYLRKGFAEIIPLRRFRAKLKIGHSGTPLRISWAWDPTRRTRTWSTPSFSDSSHFSYFQTLGTRRFFWWAISTARLRSPGHSETAPSPYA